MEVIKQDALNQSIGFPLVFQECLECETLIKLAVGSLSTNSVNDDEVFEFKS
jgi:hypothetical protein